MDAIDENARYVSSEKTQTASDTHEREQRRHLARTAQLREQGQQVEATARSDRTALETREARAMVDLRREIARQRDSELSAVEHARANNDLLRGSHREAVASASKDKGECRQVA